MLGSLAVRVVLQDGHALHRRLRVADRLADPRVEDEVAEVLLQDLDRLARVQRAACRTSSAGCPGSRRSGSGSRGSSTACSRAGRARAARGTRTAPGRSRRSAATKRVDRQQAERRRRVDQDVVVAPRAPGASAFSSARSRPIIERERELGARRGRSRRRRRRSRSSRMISVIGSRWTSTSNIERSISSGFQPCDIVRLPCGSRSIASTCMPLLGERDAEVQRRRRLGDAALLVRERDDPSQRRSPIRPRPRVRARK